MTLAARRVQCRVFNSSINRGEFRKFKPVEGMKDLLPANDFLKGYREQFVDFDPPKAKDA